MFIRSTIFVFSVLLFLAVFSSCRLNEATIIEKEELFSIPLGKLAGEIDYFQRETLRFSPDNDMKMLHGFFYIANGRSGKLMKFNSYGDLLTLIYNPDRNPYPAELMSLQTEEPGGNRKVIPWQFNSPSALAVSEKSIFVVDKVAPTRQVKEKNVLMDRTILQFNSMGEYVNFIGMDGLGGQPFPYIEDIWISNKSELIVLYRTRDSSDESWFVNWYTASGNLRYSVEIRESMIPMPAGETDLSISLDNVVPDLDSYEIYLKMTYFRTGGDDGPGDVKEVFGGTLNFNVVEKLWHDWTRLPENKRTVDDMEIASPYNLIGTVKSHQFFISLSGSNSYSMLIRDENGLFSEEYKLVLDDRDILNTDFYLSDEGILCAMVYTDSKARLVWWRTDKLVELNE